MDKKVIFAVAGAGKTSHIINSLNREARALIITYTAANYENLRNRIIDRFNEFPENIRLYTYFQFLYGFCYRPFLAHETQDRGMFLDTPHPKTRFFKRIDDNYYLSAGRKLYYNRLSKFLEIRAVIPDIQNRLSKYFDHLFVDEVQDFGGHDFDFLKHLVQANLNITLVGDFFQHTFVTSSDGPTNRSLHTDYIKYKRKLKSAGLIIDEVLLNKSHRCSPTVCSFVSNNLGIEINSHRSDETSVFKIEDTKQIQQILTCNQTVKLFYQEHHKYSCFSENWGNSKGQNCYKNVCVVLNSKTEKHFNENTLIDLAPKTMKKFYVACTRAKGNLYFVSQKHLKSYINT